MKCSLLVAITVIHAAWVSAQEPLYERVFFENSAMAKSYFYSKASYTAPSWVNNVSGKLPVNDSIFFTPGNALELSYVSRATGKWEATLQYKSIRGQDYFSPASHLVLRLFVSSATTVDQLPAIGIAKEKQSPKFLHLKPFIKGYKERTWLKVSVPLNKLGIDSSVT